MHLAYEHMLVVDLQEHINIRTCLIDAKSDAERLPCSISTVYRIPVCVPRLRMLMVFADSITLLLGILRRSSKSPFVFVMVMDRREMLGMVVRRCLYVLPCLLACP
jgi:hypothetical protein